MRIGIMYGTMPPFRLHLAVVAAVEVLILSHKLSDTGVLTTEAPIGEAVNELFELPDLTLWLTRHPRVCPS